MNTLISRYRVPLYFVLAYAISWLIWLPLVAEYQGWIDTSLPAWLMQFGAFGPMLAGIALTGLTEGRAGVKRLFAQLGRWRASTWLWFLALAVPPLIYFASLPVLRLLNGVWPDISGFTGIDELPGLGFPWTYLIWLATYGLGEELGWRGYALPQMQKTLNPLRVTFILWVLWALWHLPIFFFKETWIGMGAAGIAFWFISILPGSVWLTWLYNRSGASLLLVVLWHGTYDAMVAVAPDPVPALVTSVVWVAAVIILRRGMLNNTDGLPARQLEPAAA